MEFGNVADWVGALAGSAAAISAAAFYGLDRTRAQEAERKQEAERARNHRAISDEALRLLDIASAELQKISLKQAWGGAFSPSETQEYNAKLGRVMRRLNELRSLVTDHPRLFSAIGDACDILLFIDFDLAGSNSWAFSAKDALSKVSDRKEALSRLTN